MCLGMLSVTAYFEHGVETSGFIKSGSFLNFAAPVSF
jgi:hypothetical protein